MTKLLVFLPPYSVSYISHIVLLRSLMIKIEQRYKVMEREIWFKEKENLLV